jgi:hypothetical protein
MVSEPESLQSAPALFNFDPAFILAPDGTPASHLNGPICTHGGGWDVCPIALISMRDPFNPPAGRHAMLRLTCQELV